MEVTNKHKIKEIIINFLNNKKEDYKKEKENKEIKKIDSKYESLVIKNSNYKQKRIELNQKYSKELDNNKIERAELASKSLPISNLKLHRKLYKYCRAIMICNSKLQLKKYEFIKKENIPNDDLNNAVTNDNINSNENSIKRPIIYVPTHIGKFDIEMIYQALNDHAVLFSADEDLLIHTIDNIILKAIGVIYFDHKDKIDTKNAFEIFKSTLKSGYNGIIFPESIWNTSPNQLIYEIKYGAIKAAIETNALIVPIAINQERNKFKINKGEPFDVLNYIKEGKSIDDSINEATVDLRNILASLKMEIFLSQNSIKRIDLPKNYAKKFFYDIYKEYPWFDENEIEGRKFYIDKSSKPDYVFDFTTGNRVVRFHKNINEEKQSRL